MQVLLIDSRFVPPDMRTKKGKIWKWLNDNGVLFGDMGYNKWIQITGEKIKIAV